MRVLIRISHSLLYIYKYIDHDIFKSDDKIQSSREFFNTIMNKMILIELEIKTWFWCIKNHSRNTQNINKTMEGCEEGFEYKEI